MLSGCRTHRKWTMAEHAAVDDKWRIPDELLERIEPLLPEERPHPKGGRPWIPARKAMDAIFYVLRTGCQWKALPRGVGAASTVHDRFQAWREAGVFRKLWQAGLIEFDANVGIDWEWQAMDGAMTKAPLGGEKNGPSGAAGSVISATKARGFVWIIPCRRVIGSPWTSTSQIRTVKSPPSDSRGW